MTRGEPSAHPCGICGAAHAPFGYGLAGQRSSIPEGRRGYLWVCAAHRDEAEARKRAAEGRA